MRRCLPHATDAATPDCGTKGPGERSVSQGQAWRQDRSLSAMPYESSRSSRMS
ncbi:hypothetical protein FBY34_7921 [Streptomyces sp. SLBN-115]|nr:hypothetical protein FBY34_7921 [Streptomyces sp. SLBN-115]